MIINNSSDSVLSFPVLSDAGNREHTNRMFENYSKKTFLYQ